MIADLFITYIQQPLNLLLVFGSLLIAGIVLYASRSKKLSVSTRVFLIYLHIALLIVPVAAFAYSSGCMLPMYECNTRTLLYALPFLVGGVIATAGIVGYFGLPQLYRRRFGAMPMKDKKLQQFATAIARKNRIRAPTLWLLDTASPVAFSFTSHKPAIFISLGLFDILTPSEIKSVILHEIGHLKQRSSLMKFSTQLARVVSPVALFFPKHLDCEEHEADAFAAQEQRTSKYVASARAKIEAFFAV